jgi:hypothetical protein
VEFPRADLSQPVRRSRLAASSSHGMARRRREDSNERSQVRSAWENKKERTVPKGTIDPVVPPRLPAPGRDGIAANALILFLDGLAAKLTGQRRR